MLGTRNRRTLLAAILTGCSLTSLSGLVPARAAGTPTLSLSEPLPGSDRLPNGWGLHPAGQQVLTDRATTGVWISPDGKDIYADTSGIFEEAVVHVDGTTLIPTPTLVSDTFQGVAGDAAGNVWVAGGAADKLWQFKAAGPALIDERQAGAAPDTPNNGIPAAGYPANLTIAGNRLFVAGEISMPQKAVTAAGGGTCRQSTICSVVTEVDISNPVPGRTPAEKSVAVGRDAFGLAYRPASQTLYVSNFADQTNPARAKGDGTVSVVQLKAGISGGSEVQVLPAGLGPSGLALSPDGRLVVAADSGSDQLSVYSVDPATGHLAPNQTLSVTAGPGALPGTTPDAVAFSANGRYAYVALAGLNAVEVFSVSGDELHAIPQKVDATFDGRQYPVVVGASLIPTGWYPDALAVGPNPTGGQRLVVANLQGDGAGPGYYGQTEPLVGSSTEGSLSVIQLPEGNTTAAALRTWTTDVVDYDQLAPIWDHHIPDPASNSCVPAPLPSGPAVDSPLLCGVQRGTVDPKTLHVVVIEAENKTFDSYFGDTANVLKNANADPQWTEYGQAVTTNQHNLAETYAVDDNFWNAGAEASTLGHSSLAGSYITLDRELTWGPDYSQNLRGQKSNGVYASSALSLSGTSDPQVNAAEQVMLDPAQLLIDNAYDHGLSVRLFGTDTRPGSPTVAAGDQVPQALWGEAGSDVSTDLAWPDVDRAAMFLHGQTVSHAWDLLESPTPPSEYGKTISFSPADQQKFSLDGWTSAYQACLTQGHTDAACQQSMPNLTYMQLPENHTYDVSNVFNPQDPTPQSMVADNDYAIGEIIQGLSHSPFWKNTLVMITEDDDQFTGDHVDIHRTFVLTAGGMANDLGSRGLAADQVGWFPSIDKTAEALLGLPPMTLFDQTSAPLQQLVAARTGAYTAPYTAVYPAVPFLSGRASVP
jgi:DNA-binding beta-propeller fold protein YncE